MIAAPAILRQRVRAGHGAKPTALGLRYDGPLRYGGPGLSGASIEWRIGLAAP